MGLRSFLALFTFVSVFGAIGCSKSAQKIAPDTRGKRGESCLARNDCDTGLACIGNICSKNEFNIAVAAKQCDRVECSSDEDCCGDRATMAPAKCKDRDKICDPQNATIPGCNQTICVSDDTCNGGTCKPGTCLGSGQKGDPCTMATDCPRDTCVIKAPATTGTCALSGISCMLSTDCFYYNSPGSCSTRTCDCSNPEYDPTAPICTDKACENICLLRCSDDSLCVEDTSCKTDDDCKKVGLNICDGGRCVQCTVDDDCNTDENETCEKGLCHRPCTQDEECGLFEACNKKSGDCDYVGCKSDRECILAAARGTQQGTGGSGNVAPLSSGSDDPRLYKCLPSEQDPKVNTCKIPCENDGSCGQFQACDNGYCKFIGCESDEECRAYLGIANQMTSDTKPYIATAVCREAPTSASSK